MKYSLRILYILETFPSLTESFISQEIKGLLANGLDIQVLAFKKELDLSLDIRVHYINTKFNIRYLNKLVFSIRNVYSVYKSKSEKEKTVLRRCFRAFKFTWFCPEALQIIKSEGITHIHAHFATMPTDLARVFARFSGVPYSFSAHAHDIYTQQPGIINEKLNDARFMVTCTDYNEKFLKAKMDKRNLHKIHKIYHGVNLDKWPLRNQKRRDGTSLKVLTVARLQEKKGLVYLCEAIGLLVNKGLKVSLCIVGDGPQYTLMDRLIQESNLTDYITLAGSVLPEKIQAHYKQADVFVLPSIIAYNGDRDGLPNVLLEALATGVPVITTAISGINELVIPEQTGLIVPERNAEAIAGQIERLQTDKLLAYKLVRNGRKKVEQFKSEIHLQLLNQLFVDQAI